MNEGVSTKYLDGMRLFGCLSVLWFHLGFFLPGSGIGRIFYGPYAVTYFLILSSFVMALSFFKKGKTRSADATWVFFGRRYMRLTPVALIATLFAFAVVRWFPYAHTVNAAFPMEFLNNVYPEEVPFFSDAAKEGLVGLFVSPATLDPPLWTLESELVGLFLTYILCELCYDKKWRRIFYLALIVLFFFAKVNFCKLLVGLWLGDLFFNPAPAVLSVSLGWLRKKRVAYPLLFAALFMFLFLTFRKRYALLEILSVIFFIAGFLYLDSPLKKILEWKPFLALSGHTYTVYALHWPLIYSAGCALLMGLCRVSGNYTLSVLLMIAAVTIAVWILAIALDAGIKRVGEILSPKKKDPDGETPKMQTEA